MNVVLGGTSGIGFAVAKAASAEGAKVVVGSSSQTRVTAAVAALGAGARGWAVNLSDETATRAFFEAVGEFDHLVYTAGESLQFLGLDADLAEVRRFFELRYWRALAASAMEGLTRALAVELKPLRVNCVAPGVVKTDLWAGRPPARPFTPLRPHACRLAMPARRRRLLKATSTSSARPT